MARRQLVKGWDWVKTERVFLPEQPKKQEETRVPARSSNREALTAVALTAGVVFGLAGLYWYQRKQAPERPIAQSAPQVVYVSAPEPEPVRQLTVQIPDDPYYKNKLKLYARFWANRDNSPNLEVAKQRIWEDILPGVPYPGPAQRGDHPSVGRARLKIWLAILDALDEPQPTGSKSSADSVPVDPPSSESPSMTGSKSPPQSAVVEAKPLAPEKLAELTSEWPAPGRFCRLDAQHVELGVESVATQAIAAAVLQAAQREGWTAEKATERARKMMENAQLCSDYTSLLEQSRWNAERLPNLRVGQLVWCPPITTRPLLDRTRKPKARLDQRPWSDGSSRLEPPPSVWVT